MSKTIQKVENNIKKYNLIKEKDSILIGLSGGPDSVMLLYALIKIQNSLDFQIYASHINHLYRGDDAYKDETYSSILLFFQSFNQLYTISIYTK
ncbi:MAG: hypothetical protein H0S78_12520 [Tissierellales bacterium]|nr:hypothetical protein [Tissierellales bacterium]